MTLVTYRCQRSESHNGELSLACTNDGPKLWPVWTEDCTHIENMCAECAEPRWRRRAAKGELPAPTQEDIDAMRALQTTVGERARIDDINRDYAGKEILATREQIDAINALLEPEHHLTPEGKSPFHLSPAVLVEAWQNDAYIKARPLLDALPSQAIT